MIQNQPCHNRKVLVSELVAWGGFVRLQQLVQNQPFIYLTIVGVAKFKAGCLFNNYMGMFCLLITWFKVSAN